MGRDDKYQETLEQLASSELASAPAEDRSFSKEAVAEDIRNEIKDEITRRSRVTTSLRIEFGSYMMRRFVAKEFFKKIFFWITMGILVVALIFFGFILVRITRQPLNGNFEGIAAFVTAVVGGITALLVLPNIIANYLFNKEEDMAVAKWLSEMATQDSTELNSLLPNDKEDDAKTEK